MADHRTTGPFRSGEVNPLIPVSGHSFLRVGTENLILLWDRERVLDVDCGARWMGNM